MANREAARSGDERTESIGRGDQYVELELEHQPGNAERCADGEIVGRRAQGERASGPVDAELVPSGWQSATEQSRFVISR